MRALVAVLPVALCFPISRVQARTAPAVRKAPAFYVVSVKPAPRFPGRMGIPIGVSDLGVMPGALRVGAATLVQLVAFAYSTDFHGQISGASGWMRLVRWSIEARTRPGSPDLTKNYALAREMTRRLLADRFGLKVRREARTLPVYELRLAGKRPQRLTPARNSSAPHVLYCCAAPNDVFAEAMTMADLAGSLSGAVGRTVIDETGLKGTYQFKVRVGAVAPRTPMAQAMAVEDRDLIRALGLKLVSGTAPVGELMITGASRPKPD